uniref:Uncharacterized protein n=1 Tax=Glossina morsitans morsitans TaxID=37546 RepID=A0A1B0FLD3_GLOMM
MILSLQVWWKLLKNCSTIAMSIMKDKKFSECTDNVSFIEWLFVHWKESKHRFDEFWYTCRQRLARTEFAGLTECFW